MLAQRGPATPAGWDRAHTASLYIKAKQTQEAKQREGKATAMSAGLELSITLRGKLMMLLSKRSPPPFRMGSCSLLCEVWLTTGGSYASPTRLLLKEPKLQISGTRVSTTHKHNHDPANECKHY